jgi:hypothetical protein
MNPNKPMGSWKLAWTRCRKQAGSSVGCMSFAIHSCPNWQKPRVADSTLMALTGHMSKRMLVHYSHVRNQAKRDAIAVFESVVSRTESPQSIEVASEYIA